MLFNSLSFALLLGLTILLHRFSTYPGWVLLGASAVFYCFAGIFDSTLFVLVITANWLLTLWDSQYRLHVAVAFNIGLLAGIKYWDFLFGGAGLSGSYVDVTLPLGISFYTFQILAYQIDLARGDTKPASSLPQFATFVAFFPQLIAGPIVRAKQLLPQIERIFTGRRRRLRLLSLALGLILLGLTKKVVFADSLAPIVDELFVAPLESVFDAWLAAYLFAFQIYFDFSGYSDIAVGAAYLVGIRLPFNFATPYISTGPREFWQRWHITLSQWIRDYLYVPLGGSRGHPAWNFVVLLLVMSLAGLWHGASLTFALWGTGWGLYIAFARLASRAGISLHPLVRWLPHMAAVTVLWVLFRTPGFDAALSHIAAMFGCAELPFIIPPGPGEASLWMVVVGSIALMGLHAGEWQLRMPATILVLRRLNSPLVWGLFTGIALLIVMLPSEVTNPFIYFRF